MPIANNYPTVAPSLNLDFANSQQLDPRINFTRAGTGTYYDGETSAIAEQNLLLQSQNFTTSWSGSGYTITANSTTAPDGTSTASTFSEGSTTGIHWMYIPAQALNGTYTSSIYFKYNTLRYVQINAFTSFGSGATATFDLVNITSAIGNTGQFTAISSSMTLVGSGWYRCTLTWSTTTAINSGFGIGIFSTNSSAATMTSYTGGNLDSYIWGAQLEQHTGAGVYVPTTTVAVTNYIPQLRTAPINEPRFDFNPVTRQSLGLLMEQSITNLLTYSSQFDNAAWTKPSTTATAAYTISPDGTLNASLITATATSGTIYNGHSIVSGTTYTFSVYAKSVTSNTLAIDFSNVDGGGPIFTFSTATWSTVANWTTTVQAVGNGWFRISASRASTATGTGGIQFRIPTNGQSVALFGAQAEALPFPTSYISTGVSQVTRAADAASITGTNFSSWYNNAEGTIYSEGVAPTSGFFCLYAITDAIGTNTISNYYNTSDYMFYVRNDQGVQAQPDAGTLVTGFNKFSGAYKTNDFAISLNGGTVATDTSGAVPVVNRLLIGSASGQQSLNGTIKKLAYYPIRLTNAQLQALTGS